MQEILSVLIALAAVIGLIYLTLYATKHLMKKFNFGQNGGNGIKIVSCAGVGQDKSIVAVKAGSKNLLLGVSAAGINVLAELSDEDIAAMDMPAAASENKSFGEILAENMKKQFGGKKDGKQ